MTPLEQPSTALTGRYEIEREIGAGGMATVQLARDVALTAVIAAFMLTLYRHWTCGPSLLSCV